MTEIDVSGFAKFGNLNKNGGVNAAFDSNDTTSPYREASTAFWGVDFSSDPKRIAYAEVTPANQGMDGSGSTTSITLSLYAKNGSAPANDTDGTLLGQLSFTDVNSQLTRSITSNDNSTLWDYVWVKGQTGVWVQVSETRFFESGEPAPIPSPDPATSDVAVYTKSVNGGYALPQAITTIPGFTFDVAADGDGVAVIDARVNIEHTNVYSGAVGVGLVTVYKFAEDYADLDTENWKTPDNNYVNGANVEERSPAHYTNVAIHTSMPVEEGFYRFGLRMTGHSDGSGSNGLVRIHSESGKGLNGLRVTIFKSAQFFDMND